MIKRIVNPVLVVTIAILLISGVSMFFDIKSSVIKELHEIMGIIFVFAFIGHMLSNAKWLPKTLGGTVQKLIILAIIAAAGVAMFLSEKRVKKPSPAAQTAAQTQPSAPASGA